MTTAASGRMPASGAPAACCLMEEVSEEEVVVDDDDVGFEGLAAHGGNETLFPVGAGLAEAGLGAGVELGPEMG